MRAAAIGGAMGTLASGQASMADKPTPSQSSVPTVTLGRTGQKVTILGMGTSWALSPSFVQAAIYSGVRYMDGRIHVAVSEMTTRSDLRENVAASASRRCRHGSGSCSTITARPRPIFIATAAGTSARPRPGAFRSPRFSATFGITRSTANAKKPARSTRRFRRSPVTSQPPTSTPLPPLVPTAYQSSSSSNARIGR